MSMRRKRGLRIVAASISFLLLCTYPVPAGASGQIALNNENVCTGAWGSSNVQWQGPASRFTTPAAATITKGTIRYFQETPSGSSSYTNQSMVIWSNTGSLPATKLGTLFPSAYSGFQATFTGSISLPSAGTYWMQIQNTNGSMFCYQNTVNTTGSTAGWSTQLGIAYGSTGSGTTPTAFTAFGSPQNAYQLVYSLYIAGPETATVTASETLNAAKGITNTLTATTSTTGTVTFFVNAKRIPNCINLIVATNSRTCSWRPAVTGSSRVNVTFKPTTGSPVASNSIFIRVRNRTNTR